MSQIPDLIELAAGPHLTPEERRRRLGRRQAPVIDMRCLVCGKDHACIVHGSVRKGDMRRYCMRCEPGREA